jgi:hypothetical protein
MIKKKLIVLSVGFILPFFQAYAQYAEDAILFSRHLLGGTARMQAIGGAQVGLGGDITNAAVNSAGLGFFNRSEITISPAFNSFNTLTDYNSVESSQFGTGFNFANFGIVFNNTRDDLQTGAFRGGSFAISFNRMNFFRNEMLYEGRSEFSSILDHFAEQATGFQPNNIPNSLAFFAYDQFLINPDDNLNYDPILGDNDIPQQEGNISSRGSQNVWNFSYGANFDDMFYIGGGVGITSINYRRDRNYKELFVTGPLEDLIINENLRISGAGINANLGAIFRPTDFFRIGASIITPTYYTISDNYVGGLESRVYVNGQLDPLSDQTNQIVSNYSLTTPLRLNTGAAFFFGKNGFVSADVEYLNYRRTRLNSFDFNMAQDNQIINNFYKPAMNLRIGGEYRIEQFRLRGGIAHYGDPHDFNDNTNRSRNIFSIGGGIRLPDFFVDLAILQGFMRDRHVPFTIQNPSFPEPSVDVRNRMTNLVVTVGFNF